METTTSKLKVLDIQEKHEAKNYPYGRLRTSAFYSIEFKKGKGFRNIFQTINPKTDKLNAEKKGVYHQFCCVWLNEENGHFENGVLRINSFETINKTCKFITDNFIALNMTWEMIEDLYISMIACSNISAHYTECDRTKLVDLLEPSVKKLVEGCKEKSNVFSQVAFDLEAIKNLEINHKKTA